MTCPHCGAAVDDVDRGATGLDLCTRCGGLSRRGKALQRVQPFSSFDRPTLVDADFVEAQGAWVAAVVAEDGRAGIAVSYVLGGRQLTPILLLAEAAERFGGLVTEAVAAAGRMRN